MIKIWPNVKLYLTVMLIVAILSACAGTSSPNGETWSLVELLTKNEITDTATEVVQVRSCGVVERKTTECSAGTTQDLSVTVGGGGGISAGYTGQIEAGVSSGLGMGRVSGESLNLDSPESGSIYLYTIDKEYRVINGKVLAKSSTGKMTEAYYSFHASCSIKIISVETVSCDEAKETLTVEVAANSDWQRTNIRVDAGDSIIITYLSGTWSACAPYGCLYHEPQGNEQEEEISVNWPDNVITGCRHAALIARINDAAAVCIGNGMTMQALGTGYLELRINDVALDDNDGSVKVEVQILAHQ